MNQKLMMPLEIGKIKNFDLRDRHKQSELRRKIGYGVLAVCAWLAFLIIDCAFLR